MSAKFETIFSGLEVEITHDLEIVFPNHDLTFDRAAYEFGYPKSTVMRLSELWQSDPMNVVELYLLIPRMTRMLVACDWAEHVLPIFEERAPKRVRRIPRSVTEAARQYLTNVIRDDTMVKWQIGAKLKGDALRAEKAASGYAGYAAELAAKATLYVAESLTIRFIDTSPDVSSTAAAAFAWYDTDNTIFPDTSMRQTKKEEEYTWQVRRLVDVVEALQAGKPRPPLETTP